MSATLCDTILAVFPEATEQQRILVKAIIDLSGKSVQPDVSTPSKKLRKRAAGAGGKGYLFKSAEIGHASCKEHVVRMRDMGAPLPRDDDEAEKYVEVAFKKSAGRKNPIYRQYPNGDWGLLKPKKLTAVA
jgi:hypothetical protein